MNLTFGNIKKSKKLKYHYTEDLDDIGYLKKLEEYHLTIENNFYSSFIEIESYLHDSRIKIKKEGNTVILDVHSRDNDLNEPINFHIIFEEAKIISWNCVKGNGHIARLNKKYIPTEYGYEEFYEDNGKKYVSIIMFGKKIKKTIYYPFITIQFQKIKIEKYVRSIV